MTKLNLHKKFNADTANDSLQWELRLQTSTREELIHLGIFLAKSFKADFFYDAQDSPLIAVRGDNGKIDDYRSDDENAAR